MTSTALERARRVLQHLEAQIAGFDVLSIPAHLVVQLEEQRQIVADREAEAAALPLAPPPGWMLAHPYPAPPDFTGRREERALLSAWLMEAHAPRLLLLCALGGFGKSALTWHWLLHDVDPARFSRVVWWSFYETGAHFGSFLAVTLAYFGVDPARLGPRQQVDALLHLLRAPGALLILDGFERELRAYGGLNAAYQGDAAATDGPERDCISPLAEQFLRGLSCLPDLHGKALLTTRLRPRALEQHGALLAGCREVALAALTPADAAAFLRARGVRGNRAELEAAGAPYGYHPLSLSLLAGLLLTDPRQPGDVAAAARLDVSGDLVQRQHHVLEQAYANLPPERRDLLGRIACFRGAVGYAALEALAGGGESREGRGESREGRGESREGREESREDARRVLDAGLRDLVERGVLHHDRQHGRYDLHPIVRRYAYDRLRDPAGVHAGLVDYFAAVPAPERVQTLDDLAPVIELYHHTVYAGRYDEAFVLLRDRLIPKPLYYQFGAYQLCIDLLRALFPDGEDALPRLKEASAQGWTLNALANSYSLSGQPRRAIPLIEQANAMHEKRGDQRNLAVGLGNVAQQQLVIGALRAAEANLRRRIALCRELEEAFQEAVGQQDLGRLLVYRGAWEEAEQALALSSRYWEQTHDVQGLCLDEAYRALRALWMRRAGLPGAPLPLARRALELADEDARTVSPVERDYVRAHWLLGAAHLAEGDPAAAERHLTEALTRCRGINSVDAEADILLDLARVRAAQGAPADALALAEDARLITERSGYVLQGADVHLFLAQAARAHADLAAARVHAQQARTLATCDGEPYVYRVAYDEAGEMLRELG